MTEQDLSPRTTMDGEEAHPGVVVVAENTNLDPDQPPQSDNEQKWCSCWHGWCSFPQVKTRRYRLIWLLTFLSGIVAFGLSDAAVDVCGFVEAVVLVHDDNTPYMAERRGVGINVYEDNDGECISWRKGEDKDLVYDDSDKMWMTVRYLVGVASVVAGIGVVVLGFVMCVAFSKQVWQILEIIWLGVWFLYSLSFILFGSELCTESNEPTIDDGVPIQRDCDFDIGAGLALAGILVWIPSSYGLWILAHTLAPETATCRRQSQSEVNAREAASSVEDEPEPVQDPTKLLTGWALVSGILISCSAITNAVVIKRRS